MAREHLVLVTHFFTRIFKNSFIHGTMDCKSVANEEYTKELNQVFTFMAGIVATHSEEIAESFVTSIVSDVNFSGRTSDAPHFGLALYRRMQLLSKRLYTELVHIFGKSLDIMDMTFCRLYSSLKISFSALFLALGINTSLTSLDLRELIPHLRH